MGGCSRGGCDEVPWPHAHRSDLCVEHLLRELRMRRWPVCATEGCDKKIYFNCANRLFCVTCEKGETPNIHTTDEAFENARRVMAEFMAKSEPVPVGVPHDC